MSEFDRTNVSYVANFFRTSTQECLANPRAIRCLTAMEKYGVNKWWTYKDIEKMAYYQVNEPVLLVSYTMFQAGLEKLLQRPVKRHEMEYGQVRLRKETEKAFAKRFLCMQQEEN